MTKNQQRLFREDWFLPEPHVPAAGPACALGAAGLLPSSRLPLEQRANSSGILFLYTKNCQNEVKWCHHLVLILAAFTSLWSLEKQERQHVLCPSLVS